MVPLQKLTTTDPDSPLWSALEKMGRDGVNQLPVMGRHGIVGILSREDVLHYLNLLQAFPPESGAERRLPRDHGASAA
jgi:predicted transcriptional regulator